jgi:3D (Asp-Asp-Asp) domain-containing protein
MGIKKGLATAGVALGILFAGSTAASAQSNDSVVDYLYAQGKDSSFSNRTELAAGFGIDGYRGTAAQNLLMLDLLQGGEAPAEKPEAQPVAAPAKAEAKPAPATKPAEKQGKTITVEATAYTAYCTGCSGVTATGIDLKANPGMKVIAVDPSVIPLGSKVYVEGYGQAIAGDTGGAIKGSRIDIFMPNKSNALSFGRKSLQVTILD